MPGNVDETKWNEAKKSARKTYPDLSEDGDKFWKIVQSIYDSMHGKRMSEKKIDGPESFNERVEKHLAKKRLEKVVQSGDEDGIKWRVIEISELPTMGKYVAQINKGNGFEGTGIVGFSINAIASEAKRKAKDASKHLTNNQMHEPHAGDTAAFDVHSTDPARLKRELKRDLGIKDSPNSINNPRPKPDPIEGIQSAHDKYMEKKI